jgi:superfamily II DNA or RNA helicase
MKNKTFKDLIFYSEYRTGSPHPPAELYLSAFKTASLYKRASGYFSTSILSLFKKEILEFCLKGGKIEIACSPIFSEEDLKLLSSEFPNITTLSNSLENEIKVLIDDGKTTHVEFVGTLLKFQKLVIKIVLVEGAGGIFHDKTGLFFDEEGNMVSFSGSANESFNAISGSGNFERIKIFRSWMSDEGSRVRDDLDYLNSLFNNQIPNLKSISFPLVSTELLKSYARKNISSFSNLEFKTAEILMAPKERPSSSKTLLPFQRECLENWELNGKTGILKLATGSGKTFTAIKILEKHVLDASHALIIVPGKLLIQQWYIEIKRELPQVFILRCGDGHTTWKKRGAIENFLSQSSGSEGSVILATNDTATNPNFLKRISNYSEKLLLISDEVHSLGSESNRKIFQLDFGYRLGLSATPERYRDDEGTTAIFEYFNGIIKPVVSLADAIQAGRLVNYQYFPHVVPLTADEEQEWENWTVKITNYIRSNKPEKEGKLPNDSLLNNLFIQRSRIIKKAEKKTAETLRIIEHNYSPGEHWLIYCEDTSQLEEINDALRMLDFEPLIYTSAFEGHAEAELKYFERNGGILLSIRCLDEGIDIPKISHAIIIASSQNPRQFIQRRGRVLRFHADKPLAKIYDILVKPIESQSSENKFSTIILSELKRAIHFSKDAVNNASSESTLRNYLINLGIDPNEIEDFDGLE